MMSNKRTAPPMIIRRRRRGFTTAVGSEGCATGFDGSGEIFEVSTERFSVGSDESGAVGSFICSLRVHIYYSRFRKQMFQENVRQPCHALLARRLRAFYRTKDRSYERADDVGIDELSDLIEINSFHFSFPLCRTVFR